MGVASGQSGGLMTPDDLARASGVSRSCVMRNRRRVPGVVEDRGRTLFPVGSRYPFNVRGSKTNVPWGCHKAILRALAKGQYVDAPMLGIEQRQFERRLEELLDAGLVVPNGCGNAYGANSYDLSVRGGLVVELLPSRGKKMAAMLEAGLALSEVVASLLL